MFGRRRMPGAAGVMWTLVMLLAALLPSGCFSATTAAPAAAVQRLGDPVFAAWSLPTPEAVTSAAALGITLDIVYNAPPEPASPLGRAITAAHMKVVSAEISTVLAELECTRTHTVVPPPSQTSPFCALDPGESLEELNASVLRIVRRDSANPLVAGYWVLDDVAAWDVGGLREALSMIRNAVPSGAPTVCGFSAQLDADHRDEWDGRIAANFSPSYCDVVAPYVYAQTQPRGAAPAEVDWDMADLLPRIFHSLRNHGWQPGGQPLLGVAQAWSGRRVPDGRVMQQPREADIVAQAEAFCRAGAIGVAWYAWELSDYPGATTPRSSPEMARGIRAVTRSGCRT